MGKPQSDEDQLNILLRGLVLRFEGTRDLIRELNLARNRAIQILIAKRAAMDESGNPRQKTHPDDRAL